MKLNNSQLINFKERIKFSDEDKSAQELIGIGKVIKE
jgi:hypothetical protein